MTLVAVTDRDPAGLIRITPPAQAVRSGRRLKDPPDVRDPPDPDAGAIASTRASNQILVDQGPTPS